MRLDPDARDALHELTTFYRPSAVTYSGHYIYSEHGLVNWVPEATIELGMKVLARVDKGIAPEDVLIIPVDSHCILIP